MRSHMSPGMDNENLGCNLTRSRCGTCFYLLAEISDDHSGALFLRLGRAEFASVHYSTFCISERLRKRRRIQSFQFSFVKFLRQVDTLLGTSSPFRKLTKFPDMV